MAKKKDVIAILKAFESSKYRLEFKAKMEEEKKSIEAKLDEDLVDETGLSIHSLWRKMRAYLEGLEVIAKDMFGETE